MKIKLGTKSGKSNSVPAVESPEPQMYYPNMYISDTKLPVTADDIGKTMIAVVQLKVTGINQRTNTKETTMNYDFEVHSIEFNSVEK